MPFCIYTVTEDRACSKRDVSQGGDGMTLKNQKSSSKNKWRESWLDNNVTVDMKVIQLYSVKDRPKLILTDC